ncbi:MAG: PD-(D/E)XK nuclease family protein [Oscillospiraceae bacterium]
MLQYLHFADARTPEGIRAQVETLTARGELTGREAQAVDTASLLRLGQTPLGAQLAAAEAAGTLRREFRFSLLCPAETFFPGAGDEQVLLQGVVDAWFETKDGLVIVDYKTDRIRPEGVPARTAYYAAQLRAYAGAMARITGRPVCRRVLYFLHCGRISDVPGPDA